MIAEIKEGERVVEVTVNIVVVNGIIIIVIIIIIIIGIVTICLDYTRHYSHKCIGVRRNARDRVFQPLLFRRTYRWGQTSIPPPGEEVHSVKP